MQNNFDLKKYLIENKLTRLSENDDEDEDFNITVSDKWGMIPQEEEVIELYSEFGKPPAGSEEWDDFVYEWLEIGGLDWDASEEEVKERMSIVYNTFNKWDIEYKY